jgi:PAS domain S-box-containing protein
MADRRDTDEGAGGREALEDIARQLREAMAGRHSGPVTVSAEDPALRRLAAAVDELLGKSRAAEAQAEALARERDSLDHSLSELEERLADEVEARQRVSRELAQQRSVLRNVIDAFPYCIFWKDRDGVYLGANNNKLRALGLRSIEQLVGKTDYDTAVSREDADFYRSVDRQVMDSGSPIMNLEETQQRPDGPHVLLTSKVPLRDDSGQVTGILGMYIDVTERTRLDPDPHNDQALRRLHRLFGPPGGGEWAGSR